MALPAVTTQRIEAVLKDEELEYGVDDDNEVFASFVNANFFYRIVEDIELLFIYGYWRAETADSDLVARLREFIKDKNSDIYLPKLTMVFLDDGLLRVGYEYSAPVGGGLTDEQLHNTIIAVFGTTFSVLEELEQVFPELVTWDVEEGED